MTYLQKLETGTNGGILPSLSVYDKVQKR